jgi:surface polysaccharide O-acyltransferase-like enzyme
MIKKIGYGFLIIGYLNLNQRVEDPSTYYDEMMQIIAYLIFFEIIWVLIMPYNIRK